MAAKDFTRLITPNLDLTVGDKTYTVTPPSKEVGAQMLAANVVGLSVFTSLQDACPTCGRSGEVEIAPKYKELAAQVEDMDLGELSLGEDVYNEMVADGLDGALMDKLALYAFYYWTMGESVADAIVEEQWATTSDGEPAPKDQ